MNVAQASLLKVDLKPFPIEEWIHYLYWGKFPIDTIAHNGITLSLSLSLSLSLCKFNRNLKKKKKIWQALSTQTEITSNKPQSRHQFFTWKTLQWEGKNHGT